MCSKGMVGTGRTLRRNFHLGKALITTGKDLDLGGLLQRVANVEDGVKVAETLTRNAPLTKFFSSRLAKGLRPAPR